MSNIVPKDNLTPDTRRKNQKRNENKQRRNYSFIALCVLGVIVVALVVRGVIIKIDDTTHFISEEFSSPVETPVPEIPAAEEQNDLLKIALNATGESTKVCYLTFDDGPTAEVTPAVLDVLKEYDVKATFFMLGKNIEAYQDITKRVFDEGHLPANHSYSHVYDNLYSSGTSFMEEIHKTESLIRNITGVEPFKLMRFPGGASNSGKYGEAKQSYKHILQENGYYYADWNALNGDAEGSSRTPEQLLARIKETAKYDKIVVLLHDASTKQTTAESLPAIIEYLKSQGYAFKRLDEIKYYGGAMGENSDSPSMIM